MGLAWVSGQLRELWLEGGDVLVPSVGVRVLLDLWCLLELLEALDVGLGWAIAVCMSARDLKFHTVCESGKARNSKVRGAQKRVGSTHLQGLKLLINTDQIVLIIRQGKGKSWRESRSYIPNDVAVSLGPVVEDCMSC